MTEGFTRRVPTNLHIFGELRALCASYPGYSPRLSPGLPPPTLLTVVCTYPGVHWEDGIPRVVYWVVYTRRYTHHGVPGYTPPGYTPFYHPGYTPFYHPGYTLLSLLVTRVYTPSLLLTRVYPTLPYHPGYTPPYRTPWVCTPSAQSGPCSPWAQKP